MPLLMPNMLIPGPHRRQGIEAAGATYLEAPVSGSKGPAEAGQLVFLAGGERALFDRAAPALDVMGKASFYLGPVRPPSRPDPIQKGLAYPASTLYKSALDVQG